MIITSNDNKTIKKLRKIKQNKLKNGEMLIEGTKMIDEAINENAKIELIVLREDIYNNIDLIEKNTLRSIKEKNIEIIGISKSIFNELTDVTTSKGVLALVDIKKEENDDIEKEIDINTDYILFLDGIQDPGNLGTIIRTASSANLKQIIISKDTVYPYSSKVIRSTMGSIFRVKILETNDSIKTLNYLKQNGFKIISTSLQTDKSIYDIKYDKTCVIIGNEGNGVKREIQDLSDYKVKIPMLGKTESLNASVAAGIMIYEYVRNKINK